MCAICVCTCARCCHVYVVQDEDEKKKEAAEKAIEKKGEEAAIKQGGDKDAVAAAAAANDKDPTSTDPAATEAAASASLAKDLSMNASDAGGHEGREGVVEEEGQLSAEKIAANKAHMVSLNLQPPPSAVTEGDTLEVLGACFELTPKSTVEDIEAKRSEILKARITGGRLGFLSHFMSADTDDKYDNASIPSIAKLRVRFLELVEMYAVRHKIVDDSYLFDEPQSRSGTPRRATEAGK